MMLYPTLMNDTYFLQKFTHERDGHQIWEGACLKSGRSKRPQNLEPCSYTMYEQQSEMWIHNLMPKMAYKFKLRQCAEFNSTLCTGWSDWKVLATPVPKQFEKNEYAYLTVQGTGLNNHNATYIKIDDKYVVNHAFKRGFALVVLNRTSLEKVCCDEEDDTFYDLLKDQEVDTIMGSDLKRRSEDPAIDLDLVLLHKQYEVADDGNTVQKKNKNDGPEEYEDIDMIYNRTNIWYESNRMAKKIREYSDNSDVFIIVSSIYGWEKYFSDELGHALENCGASLFSEFTHNAKTIFGNITKLHNFDDGDLLYKTKLFHPYALIGIPGLPPGKAFEQLRSNRGIYMERSTLPHATLKVRLRYNSLIGMYSFDIMPKQYHRQSKFIDKIEDIHDSYDRSLRAVYPMQVSQNLTSEYNYGTSIFEEPIDMIHY